MITLEDFINEKSKGIIFYKIGKSNLNIGWKTGCCPYNDCLGNVIVSHNDSVTFARLDDVIKYLHYRDELIVFNFTEATSLLNDNIYYDNGLNKKFYQAPKLYVKYIVFHKASTVDFIYQHLQDKTYFYEYSNIAISQLKQSDLFNATNH